MIAAGRNLEIHSDVMDSYTRTDIPVLTFHNSLLPRDERMDEKAKSQTDVAMEALARRKASARRTAWIIAAIAAAFFIASLVQGHFTGIPNWVPPGH